MIFSFTLNTDILSRRVAQRIVAQLALIIGAITIKLYSYEESHITVMVPSCNLNKPMFNSVFTRTDALTNAESLVSIIANDFFTLESYDIYHEVFGEPGFVVHSVQYWEKIDEGFYSGNKIFIQMSEDGYLRFFVARSSRSESFVSDVNENRIKLDTIITEDQAIQKAYNAVAQIVTELEKPKNHVQIEYEQKTGNSIIISEAEMNEDDRYMIMIGDTLSHSLVSYRELIEGNIKWIIEITDVETNRSWHMSFLVIIDAKTGTIDFVDYTR
jgi:hypothetical protein